MVDPLLADKDCATFETDLAKGLLMYLFKMATQALDVRKHVRVVAVKHQALQRPKLRASSLRLFVVVHDRIIFLIFNSFLAPPLLELRPCKGLVAGHKDLFELSLADGALLILHNEAQTQAAFLTSVLMITDSHCEEVDWVIAQNAVVRVAHITFNSLSCFYHFPDFYR